MVGAGIQASIDAIAEVDPAVPKVVTQGRPGVEPDPVLPGAYRPDIIVLLTDGASNAGPEPLEAAKQAAARGLRVYTIGFGTALGGELNASCRAAVPGQRAQHPGWLRRLRGWRRRRSGAGSTRTPCAPSPT